MQDLDHALVKKNQSSSIPGFAQFKYVNRFLSQPERRIVLVALLVFFVALIGASGIFLSHHLDRVPTDGGEYSEAIIGQPKNLSPLFSSTNDVDADLVNLVYAGLFRYNQNQQLEPYLAATYTISIDQKVYDITLRDTINFSDGQPLTADDVLFTFDAIQNPEVGSPLMSTFQGVKIEKISDKTLRFTLKEPFAPFLDSLMVGILPAHIWGDIPPATFKLAKQSLQPMGAGAWQFSKLFKDETGHITSYELSKNNHYFGAMPHLQTLRFVFFNAYQEAIDAMRTDPTLSLSFVPHTLENKLNDKDFAIFPITLPQYTTLFFNQSHQPALKDDDVRLALTLAVDKTHLVADALGSYGNVIESPILSGSIGYYPDIKKTVLDVNQANTLLDKKWTKIEPEEYFKIAAVALLKTNQSDLDAFKKANSSSPDQITAYENQLAQQISDAVRKQMDASQTFYRKDKTDNILELTITTADTPEYSKTAELLATMWQAVGVRTTIRKINSQQLVRELLKKRDYDTLLYGEIIGFDPDPFAFWHSSQADYPGLNLAGYTNRSVDKLLEQARATTDAKQRDSLYKQFQDQLTKDIPEIGRAYV